MPEYPSAIDPAESHESAPNYAPTEDEEKTIKLVNRLLSESKRAKEQHDGKWVEFYKFFRGRQWPDRRPSYRHSEVLNFIHAEIQNVLVLLTDTRPQIDCLPEDPTDLEFAEIMSEVLKSKWDNNSWGYTVAEAIVDGSVFGTAVAEVPWKPELLDGLGDFTFETEDVFYFFPDPNAKARINDEYCDYVIRAKPVSVKKLKAKYPKMAEFIRSDVGDMGVSAGSADGMDEIQYRSPTDNRVLIDSDKSIVSGKPDQVLEICAYLKSDEMIEEKLEGEVDPETGLAKELFQSKKKYPNGRKIVIANNVLLEDGPNPYEDGKFPFATFVDNIIPRQIWGTGEVEQLKSIQAVINKIFSYTLDTMSLMGNPVWKNPVGSGVDSDNLTNQPGLVIDHNKDLAPEREPGVPLPAYIMQLLEASMNNIWGKLASTTEVSKGVAPSDNASGYAIAQLQEAAQTRIRGKSRNLEVFLKQVGDLMVSRILQFYTFPRIIRLTSNDNASKFFKFHIGETEDESGEVQKFAEIAEYVQDPATGDYVEGTPRQIALKSRLDVKINVGSSLPFAKLENKTLAEKLYDKQIIDAEEYLTQIDYPRKEKIIERLKAQQAAMPPPVPGGPQNGTNAPPAPAAA